MTQVLFTPSARSIDVPPGTPLLDAARQANVDLEAPCGGEGSCGQCIVRIVSGEVETDNLGILPREAVEEGYVLACRTVLRESALTVEVPETVGRTGGKFVGDEDGEWLRHDDPDPEHPTVTPFARKLVVHVPEPRLEDGLSDVDRLLRALRAETGERRVEVPLPIVRTLAGSLRGNGGEVTVTLLQDAGADYVIAVEPGRHAEPSLGVAIDVGTTTIAVQMVSLATGRPAATRIDYNAQISCGLDVISRIHYARDAKRREELRIRVLGTVNNLIRKVAQSQGVRPDEIIAAVVAGNTTMMHLLLGLPPEHIRLAPYTPTMHGASHFRAEEIGVHIHPASRVYLCPGVGSYVGGDITAGLLCTQMIHDAEGVSLFMDIGTNGELVVGNRDFLLTCACSAGPAFEGGGIEAGMRAAAGAIERVEIDPETGIAHCRTIGEGKPLGVCGSGMISILANLCRTGWVDQAGKLSRSRRSPAIQIDGRRGCYTVVPAAESGAGSAITISELDIENIMRAKAAVYSAIGLLLEHAGVTMEQLACIYIAGGFGRYLDLEDAVTIGLIPDLPREKFKFIGNSSLAGAYRVLVSAESRDQVTELSRKMTYLELNTAPSYMDQYTSALFLPHTDLRLFPSVRAAMSGPKQ